MEGMPRRELLGKALRGLGLALAGLIPGGFFFTRRALGQNQAATPQKLSPAEVSRLTSTLAQTTKQNVIQVLKSANLPPEDTLAIVAVRQLSPDEVRQSLDQIEELIRLGIRRQGAGKKCGSNCGDGCGNNCGWRCGFGCQGTVAGAFCGGACAVQPATIGVVDVQGALRINFRNLDAQRFDSAIGEAQRLVR